MNARSKAKTKADETTTFKSMDEARRFAETVNGLLGKALPIHLEYNGFYACRIDDTKHYFEVES